MQGPKFLTAEQLLLTTLVVKLVATAALATMLVRYRRFRHILIFERRAWPDRLTFALSLGIPLTAGVVARLLLGYDAAGSDDGGLVSRGADRRSLRRRDRRRDGRCAAAGQRRVGRAALRRRLRLRGRRPARAVPEGGHLALLALHFSERAAPRRGGWCDRWRWTGRSCCCSRRSRSRCSARRSASAGAIITACSCSRRTRRGRGACSSSSSPRCSCVATPIKIWNNARIEHRLQEQEKLLLAAKIEALANQINPHFLFNTLTSISSLIRTQPDTARMLITKLSGLLRRLMRSTDHFVTLREELASIDEYLDIEVVRFGPQLQGREADRAADARRDRAEHDPAAAGRELDQARPGAQGRRRPHHDHDQRLRRPHDHRSARRRPRHDRGAAGARARRRHRPEQRQRAPAHDLRPALPPEADERPRAGHLRERRDSRDRAARAGHADSVSHSLSVRSGGRSLPADVRWS